MAEVIIHELPKKEDKIKIQYFKNSIEIRANMTGLIGSGRLLVEVKVGGFFDPTRKEIEEIYNHFLAIPTITGKPLLKDLY